MEYRKLNGTDLELSVVTFGAWAAGGMMWGGTDHQASIEAMRASYDLGVTSFDTAPVYGMGYSERLIGEALQGIPRDKVQLLTKFGLDWEQSVGEFYFDSVSNEGKPVKIYRNARKDAIIKECETSLRNLKTDYIDLYQIHWADPTTSVEESMEAVDQLIRQGKVRHAGVCNYSVPLLEAADNVLPLVSEQVPYSMVRRSIEKDIVPHCIRTGKSILAYSPLQRGLLTGKMKPGQSFGSNDSRNGQVWYKDENIVRVNAFLEALRPLAESKQATLGQLVIRWTVEQPGITVALVGARNAEQAIQNAAAARIRLDDFELEFINHALSQLELIP